MFKPLADPSPNLGTIRRAEGRDEATVLGLAQAWGLFTSAELPEIAATFTQFVGGTAAHDVWLINECDSGSIGLAYYGPERMANGVWNLFMLAVHPDHRGCGVGAHLVRYVENSLNDAQERILLIETSGVSEFAGQRAFYRRLGYVEEARIRDFYDSGDDKVVFYKALAEVDPKRIGGTPRS